jgi:hypothetical protein
MRFDGIQSVNGPDNLPRQTKRDSLNFTNILKALISRRYWQRHHALYMPNLWEQCPHVEMKFNQVKVTALVDTNLPSMAQQLYERLVGAEVLQNKTARIKFRALSSFSIEGQQYDHVFLISPQLISSVTIGVDFLSDHELLISKRNVSKSRMVMHEI